MICEESSFAKLLFAHAFAAADTVRAMKTRPQFSTTSRRKRRAVTDLFRALDTLVAAVTEAERAKRIILDDAEHRRATVKRLIDESNGRLMRGDDPRLTRGRVSDAK